MLLLLEWRHRYVDASVLFVQLLLRKGYEKSRSKLFVLKRALSRFLTALCLRPSRRIEHLSEFYQ